MEHGGLRRSIEFSYEFSDPNYEKTYHMPTIQDDTSKADLTASGASNLARAACGNDFRGRPK